MSVVYDGEFGGYVAVAGGIERPDLVVRQKSGRVPEAARLASRRARFGLRREKRAARSGKALPGWNPPQPRKAPSSRWIRTRAVTTQLFVLDEGGQPVSGARVFRYSDPAFYAVNDDDTGARLFGTYRFLPFSFSAAQAQSVLAAHEEFWGDSGFASIKEDSPDIDQFQNPWLPKEPLSGRSPLEYLGSTNEAGLLRSVSGVFNLRDETRFPRAVFPGALRIGFVVTADGYLPATSERRFEKGGVQDQQTVILLRAPDNPVVRSSYYLSALMHIDGAVIEGLSGEKIEALVEKTVASLEPAFAMVRETVRPQARTLITERLLTRLMRRAPAETRLDLARRLAGSDPQQPGRLVRLAHLLVAGAGLSPDIDPGAFPAAPSAELKEAETLLSRAINLDPGFQDAYPLLDRLLLRRGATPAERRKMVQQVLKRFPFDRWGRARMATLLFLEGKEIEAFDQLRYTWAATPGLGGDRELARQLADYYWRLGLPEKAGAYLWMLTGRVPEDPSRRVEGMGR